MRVRSAGGLLLAPVMALTARALESSSFPAGSSNRAEAFVKFLFWQEPDGGREVLVTLVRNGLFLLIVLAGLAALAGVRISRWPVVLLAAVQAVLLVPWVIWDFNQRTFSDPPPRWVFEWVPWYREERYSALFWILVLVVAAAFALSERRPAPAAPPVTAPTDPVGAPTSGWGPPPPPSG